MMRSFAYSRAIEEEKRTGVMTRVEKLKALCLANIFIVLNDFLYAYKNGKKNKPKYKECLVRCEGHLYDFSIFSPFKNILFANSGKYKIIISKVLSRGRRQADYGPGLSSGQKLPLPGALKSSPSPRQKPVSPFLHWFGKRISKATTLCIGAKEGTETQK